ncbi:MAG: hypothetical protein JSV80_06395, partial [Acidobacteriota bacterium]
FVTRADDPTRTAVLRSELIGALRRQRLRGSRRLRPGEPLGLDEAAMVVARQAASVLAVLVRRGAYVGEGRYMPRPSGELMPLPEEQGDYEIPRAGSQSIGGVELELLVVEETGRVLTHRRVAHPAASAQEILGAMPVLLREVTRGLSASR